MSQTDQHGSLEALRPFATPRQAQFIDAVIEHGSQVKAAKALGLHLRNLQKGLARVRRIAASRGHAPEHDYTNPAPEGFLSRGNSTLYDADGNVVQQWVKHERDRAAYEALYREVFEAMSQDIKREKKVPAPKRSLDADLLNAHILTDYHLGMRSWHEETGADWDTDIAEDLLVRWFAHAIASAPNAATGVLAQLGDFLHWDGMEAVTPASGNILDADTRFSKLVRVAIRSLRRVVRMLLEKHESVHLIMAEGNHDPASSVWLREWFAALYEDEPRVTVDPSPDPYYCVEHGSTSLFFHHGHKRSVKNVDDVFAAKFRDVFGRTKYSYAHVGHKHEQRQVETNLMLVEQHRTLATPDAFAARGGWMSDRGASVITYHRDHGEVGRVVIGPEMVQGSGSSGS